MCRKDFTGYMCGHCSVPTITPCPLTLSNPRFPLCKFIAEFPKRIETHCDPCRRVFFTQDVLLKEMIHIEEHKMQRCPCGNDFTEEERQARARLVEEKERDNGVKEVTRPVNEKRRETYRPRKLNQGNYLRLNDKQKSGQQEQVPQHMGHLEQYLNAPYGRHPMQPQMQTPVQPLIQPLMQPVPNHQQFHPCQPQHAFIGMGIPPMNPYPDRKSTYPFVNGGYFTPEPVLTFGHPFAATEDSKTTQGPDPYSTRNQPVQELMAEYEHLSMAERSYADNLEYFTSPAVVSSGTVPSPRLGAKERDARSI